MTISKDDAIARAREVVTARGWEWREPVHVSRQRSAIVFGKMTYEVRTNAETRGCNARVVVDADDGTVIDASFLPR